MSEFEDPDILEVIVGKSYGPRDPDLADAARRWRKIDASRRHDLRFIVARRHWQDARSRSSGSRVRRLSRPAALSSE